MNWKTKLTSRKFWVAVIGFTTTIMLAFGVPDLQVEQTAAIIAAGATLIAYIIGEGMVDTARLNNQIELQAKDSEETKGPEETEGEAPENNE